MVVEEINQDKGDLHCRITVPGKLSNNKGVNFPGVYLSIKAMTDKDREEV